MNNANLLINTPQQKKKWLAMLPFLLILAGGCCLVRWRYIKMIRKNYQASISNTAHKTIQNNQPTTRGYCFILELVQRLAPLLGSQIRFESLEIDQLNTAILKAKAVKPEYVFEFMEALESQSWLTKTALQSMHNTDDNLVSFCIHLSKSDSLVK